MFTAPVTGSKTLSESPARVFVERTSAMNLRQHAAPVALAVLVLSLSACGSSGKSATATTTAPRTADSARVDAAFKVKAAAVCKTAGDRLRGQGSFPFPNFNAEHPDVSELPAIATYEAKTVATERSWLAQLRALGQPVAGRPAWTLFMARIDDDVTETAAQQVAAQHSDGAAFTKTFHQLTAYGLSNDQIAVAIGLPTCDPDMLGTSNAKAPVPVRRP
jgi:hypothetical protein